MRLSQAPPSLVSLLLAVLLHTDSAIAGPYPKDELHDLGFSFLMDRACASYCGADNQYCCTTGQACYTNAANVAYCSAGNSITSTYASEGYAVYTTTYTQTDLELRTSTYTSSWAAGATGVTAICDTTLGQTSCGPICCASGQRCQYSGQCEAVSSAWTYTNTATSGTYSAPVRPTSGTGSTSTATVSATTTEPFIPPATASGSTLPITQDSSGSSLSGGAIAGIVIGTILGVILLLLLCFCCIVKGLWDSVLAIFGLGGRRRREGVRTERIETVERYSRHGSTTAAGAATRRQEHTGWFGGSKPTRVTETRKKSSGLGGLGAVGAGLLGTAVLLGLKKREDDKEKRRPATVVSVTDVSSTYYTDSYTGTSASMYSHFSSTLKGRIKRISY
ncbi:hypothetical protein ACMFMF_007838 [Clarireedia jacksonii]